ncbi:hypothetical protein Tco_0033754 [Tanacetum coccineum]
MSTRSNSSNLFSPLRDPESLIRRRNLGEPSSLFDFEEVMSIPYNNMGPPPARPPPPNNNGPPLVVRPNGQAPRSMEELYQPSIDRRGGPIASIPIQATDFRLRHHMIQQVQNSCQFHGLPGDDANRHIDKFLEITQRMKQNGVSDDAIRLSLFPYSLTHHAIAWYDRLPRNSIHSLDDMMRKFLSKYFLPSMVIEQPMARSGTDLKMAKLAPETSPSRITSLPSLSPKHTPVSTPSTSQPPNTQPTPDAEEAVPMPHESPLHSVHSLGRDEGSLSLSELTKVKKLEQTVKSTQARRRFRIVVSNDEEGTSWIQEDIEIQEKISNDTEVVLEEEELTELVEDQGSGEKGEKEVSTVGAKHSTVIPEVSTVAENIVYIRRSAEKKKDKGKGIMTEPEPKKKTKKQLEQERLGHEEVVRFQEQLNEEETQRIARDAEIARQLHEEINKAGQERVVAKDDQAHVIDYSDPAVLRYHAQLNRPYSVAEVRKNMVMYEIKFNPLHPWILKKKKVVQRKEVERNHLQGKEQVKSKVKKVQKGKRIEDDSTRGKKNFKAYLGSGSKEEFGWI